MKGSRREEGKNVEWIQMENARIHIALSRERRGKVALLLFSCFVNPGQQP